MRPRLGFLMNNFWGVESELAGRGDVVLCGTMVLGAERQAEKTEEEGR